MGISFFYVVLLLICIALFIWGILKKNKLLLVIAIITGIGLFLFAYMLGQALITM
jgi:hypothetical protein